MALDEPVDEDNEDEDIEDEVDLAGELISALEELNKTRREIKKIKFVAAEEQDCLKQSLDEFKKTISDLQLQLEEAKSI